MISLVLGQMAGTIKHASRRASNIAADGRDGYLLLVNNGDTILSGTQVGRDYHVGKGEAALVSASEALQMTGGDKNIWANVVVPRDVLEKAFAHVDDRLALTIGADNEALDMLKRYCRFLEAGPALVSPDLVTHATETSHAGGSPRRRVLARIEGRCPVYPRILRRYVNGVSCIGYIGRDIRIVRIARLVSHIAGDHIAGDHIAGRARIGRDHVACDVGLRIRHAIHRDIRSGRAPRRGVVRAREKQHAGQNRQQGTRSS